VFSKIWIEVNVSKKKHSPTVCIIKYDAIVHRKAIQRTERLLLKKHKMSREELRVAASLQMQNLSTELKCLSSGRKSVIMIQANFSSSMVY